jgi:hypothetical protein
MVERALIAPPRSRIGAISPPERQRIVQSSILFGTYEKTVDRESASEILAQRAAEKTAATTTTPGAASAPGSFGSILWGSTGPRGGKHEGLVETMAKSAVRTVGSTVGRELIRGVLGSLFGGSRRR